MCVPLHILIGKIKTGDDICEGNLSFLLLSFFLLSAVTIPTYAEPAVSAASAIVMDAKSGRILYAKNINTQMPMASTTKIMTAIVALEHGKLEDIVEVSAAAAQVEGSSMYLEAGEHLTLQDLLYGLMLVSGNDAAAAIAEHIAGGESAFVAMMNQKAAEIGALQTHFENPHGLPSDTHYSTTEDMAKITAYGLKIPAFAEIVATESKNLPWEGRDYDRVLTNHNKLLRLYPDCIGVKTGFTKAAGRCLVTAAARDNMTLICVTLNASDDWNDHMELYDAMFELYQPVCVLSPEQIYGIVRVAHGAQEQIEATVSEEIYFPLRPDEKFEIIPHCDDTVQAPVRRGDDIGYASVMVGGEELGKLRLTAKADVAVQALAFPEAKGTMQSYLGQCFPRNGCGFSINYFMLSQNLC